MSRTKIFRETPLKEWFTAAEAARLSDLSRTMVDYLDRIEVIKPLGPHNRCRGRSRRYAFADVVLLKAVKRMLDAGLSVKRLKQAFSELADKRHEITPEDLPGTHLVTDGVTVYFCHGRDILEDIANGQLAFRFVLEMAGVRKEVVDQLEVELVQGRTQRFQYRLRDKRSNVA